METIFEVIADHTRRNILDLLLDRPHLVGELSDALKVTQPGISKQLRILREAGLVQVRQDAQRRWYELQPEPLMEAYAWLSRYHEVWHERLNNLDAYLAKLQEREHEQHPPPPTE